MQRSKSLESIVAMPAPYLSKEPLSAARTGSRVSVSAIVSSDLCVCASGQAVFDVFEWPMVTTAGCVKGQGDTILWLGPFHF